MKKILSSIAIVALMAASCRQSPRTDSTTQTPAYTDTVGLAQYQQWKIQHELSGSNAYMQNNVSKQPAKSVSHRTTTRSSGSMNSTSSNTAKSSKKGWSRGAKGAVIGGTGGAILGAVINKKNRVLGGVVGGVVGAGAGYGIGHHIDKKKGRY